MFFQISLPNLVNYVLSGCQSPSLNQVFTKVIQSPYVKLSGGEMAVAGSYFYLIGGKPMILLTSRELTAYTVIPSGNSGSPIRSTAGH